MKPMSEEQKFQLAGDYWEWFKEKELKKWMVFSLEKVQFFSNGKHLKTMLVEDKIHKIFNKFSNEKDKNWSKASNKFKKNFTEPGENINGNTNNKTVLKNIMKKKYEKFNFRITLPSESEIRLSPEVQYRILRTYIYKICQKLIVKNERKLLSREEKIKLTLHKLSIMKKNDMDSLIQDFKKFKVTKIKNNGITSDIDEKISNKVVKDFFISGYERMRDSEFKHKYLFKYFPVCPYCNATYLFKLREKKGKETNYIGAQLDHYHPKDDFPYLAISIFNMIPSCPTCNHIKSNRKEPHLHPYTEEMGNNAKFTLSMSCLGELAGVKFENIEEYREIESSLGKYTRLEFNLKEGFDKRVELKIKEGIEEELEKRIKNSKEIFQLENKYSGVREEIRDLYFKHKLLSQSQRNETLSEFGDSLGITEKEMEEVYFGARKTDEYKRPLSKFINDIRDFLDDKD